MALVGGVALVLVLLLTLLGLPRHKLDARGGAGRWSALRLAVIVLVAVGHAAADAGLHQTKRQAATLVVLVDQSRSMSVADAVGGKTRWELLAPAVDDAAPTLAQDRRGLRGQGLHLRRRSASARFFAAARSTAAHARRASKRPSARRWKTCLRREAGKRLLGVVLLSDGAQRAYAPRDLAPQGPARRLADLGYPLFTFPFGQARGLGQARDVAVKDLFVNQTVFVKNELTVRGTTARRRLRRSKHPRAPAVRDRRGQDGTGRRRGSIKARQTARRCRSS